MLIDITRPLSPQTAVYPGDPPFEIQTDMHDIYKVSCISMCVHTGTHIDAPSHFLLSGDVCDYPLEQLCGPVLVLDKTEGWLSRLNGARRVLLRGGSGVTEEEARLIASSGVRLIGTDQLSIAPTPVEAPTHRILLGGGVCVLENADLANVPCGEYRLICLPLKLTSCEGAPVRAVLETL